MIAAEQGFTVSQIAIGMMYFTGDGVEEDDDEAEEGFRMAVEEGSRATRDRPLTSGTHRLSEAAAPSRHRGMLLHEKRD